MDDALSTFPLPEALPEAAPALKALVLTLVRQRDVAAQERDVAARERDAPARERDAALSREQELELKSQQLELEKLRLQHQMDQLKKRYYGPRADQLEVGQLLLEFAVALEKRPVNGEDLAGSLTAQAAAAVARDPAGGSTLRRVRGGRRDIALLENLPVIQRVHDLGEAEKHCGSCGPSTACWSGAAASGITCRSARSWSASRCGRWWAPGCRRARRATRSAAGNLPFLT